MFDVLTIVFWTCLALLGWSYLVYPSLVILLARLLHRKPIPRKILPDDKLPAVTIVIAAYNEEEEIQQRIENLLAQDYPPNLLHIIIASDGSSDSTVEVARGVTSDRVEVRDYAERRGKANLLSLIVPTVSTEIVAFSDANTAWTPSVLRLLVSSLAEPRVGVATGMLIIKPVGGGEIVSQEASYGNLENRLRAAESRLGTALGAYGSVYALRKSQFVPFPPNTAVDDFYEAMKLAGKGLRTVIIPQAHAYEYTAPDSRGEFRRRMRIGTGDFQNLFRLARLLLPDKGFLALAFWSHKVLRWLGPFFMLVIWMVSAWLACSGSDSFWQWAFGLQTGWHGFAVLGWLTATLGISKPRVLFLPYYFDLINLAIFVGFWRAIVKSQAAAWRKGR
jgi:cellulose synthase/poly-beta-1,6-N-acetylglucosamine synthase-like glycosyltransferase